MFPTGPVLIRVSPLWLAAQGCTVPGEPFGWHSALGACIEEKKIGLVSFYSVDENVFMMESKVTLQLREILSLVHSLSAQLICHRRELTDLPRFYLHLPLEWVQTACLMLLDSSLTPSRGMWFLQTSQNTNYLKPLPRGFYLQNVSCLSSVFCLYHRYPLGLSPQGSDYSSSKIHFSPAFTG